MANALAISNEQVKEVYVNGQWQRAFNLRTLPATVAGVKWTSAVVFNSEDGGGIQTAIPAASLGGVRLPFVKSPHDIAAERAAYESRQERLFERQHYANRATFDRVLDEQKGLCAVCRNALAGLAVVHYYEGRLLCRADSPLQPRWGED